MMSRWTITLTTTLVLGLMAGPSALAQTATDPGTGSPIACPSQQDLEQTMNSGGDIRPEGCTLIDVSRLTSDGTELCLIDFGTDEGFLGRLRDAAMPSQWWVSCDALNAALL